MKNFKIIFVGTGSAKASLKRYHSSFIISATDSNVLVDAGDGISKALLSQNISFDSIDAVLITHLHPDHFSGLASLIIQMKLSKRSKKLSLFANKNIIHIIKDLLINSYIFPERLEFKMDYIPFEEDELIKVNEGLSFRAKENSHLNDYQKKSEKNNIILSSDSFLFNINGSNIFYTADIGNENDLHLFDNEGFDYMISEITHIKPEELLAYFKLKNIRKLLLTHLSDGDTEKIDRLIAEFSEDEKEKIIFLYDGFSFILP